MLSKDAQVLQKNLQDNQAIADRIFQQQKTFDSNVLFDEITKIDPNIGSEEAMRKVNDIALRFERMANVDELATIDSQVLANQVTA